VPARNFRATKTVKMGGLPDQLRQAYKGASYEISTLPKIGQKLQRLFRILRIVISELFQTTTLAPFGLRAKRYHSLLEKTKQMHASVKYGDKERNHFDVYLPKRNGAEGATAPVVLFVHGGVWVSGDKWNYAPMARRLAEEGALVFIMEYSLFPDARAPEMSDEVDMAFTWVMENSHKYGGCSDNVSLMGHSAGCQIATMALWKRALRLRGGASAKDPAHMQPRLFMGLSGVYNVYDHYMYEFNRGVAEMSCMKPAIGGVHKFAEESIQLLVQDVVAAGGAELEGVRCTLPPTVLLHSKIDTTVPWSNSARYCLTLQEAGVPATLLLYQGGGHSEFVTEWYPADEEPKKGTRADDPPLVAGRGEYRHIPAELADIVKLATDPLAVQQAQRAGSSEQLRVEPIYETIRGHGGGETLM